MEISLHVLENHIQVPLIRGWVGALQSNDVGVQEVLQEDHLSICPLRISHVTERFKHLLEGHCFACRFIHRLPNNSVGSLTNLLGERISLQDLTLNLVSHGG